MQLASLAYSSECSYFLRIFDQASNLSILTLGQPFWFMLMRIVYAPTFLHGYIYYAPTYLGSYTHIYYAPTHLGSYTHIYYAPTYVGSYTHIYYAPRYLGR